MNTPDNHNETVSRKPPVREDDQPVAVPWEEVAAGRYMPRRIRGSCLGRELG